MPHKSRPFFLLFNSFIRLSSYESRRRLGSQVPLEPSMENQNLSPPHLDASRPSLGFPLGTALLLIFIFTLSGVFSCCYHWDKLRSLRRSATDHSDADSDLEASPSKPNLNTPDLKKKQSESLPVLMPGDDVPKFIALPCPCEPLRSESIVVQVKKPVKQPRFPAPLY